jgi:hypothetical protein
MSLLGKILLRKNIETSVTAESLRKQYKGMLYCFQAQKALIEKMDVEFDLMQAGFENSKNLNAVQLAYDDCYAYLVKTAHIGGPRSPYTKEQYFLVKDMLETSLRFFEHQIEILIK